MHNAEHGDASVPSEAREDNFYLIVSDLVSLINHVQASLTLIETAKAQAISAEQEFGDVVVLDDITPLYVQAGAALGTCNTSLNTALQFLLAAELTRSQG
jgi:hypothetical protein